jgi:high affinity Mn2+ porin
VRKILLSLAIVGIAPFSYADQDEVLPRISKEAAQSDASASDSPWAVSAQLTNITQKHDVFRSPYSGTNSLTANGRMEETTDMTLFAGVRLGANTELWLNPEIDQGFGLSNTLGVAGYPSGGAYKLGANTPYLRLPRAFIRHVISLGNTAENVDAAANQFAGSRSVENLTLTFGKFSVVDIFDTNTYAHDPRADFLNWSIIEAGAFDYAADVWGYTNGVAAEWNQQWGALRAGLFQLSPEPNSKITGIKTAQYSFITEWEKRIAWQGHPGKIKLLGFINRANMSTYQDALKLAALTGNTPDVALTRHMNSNVGYSLNIEQELANDLGLFVRLSKNRGDKEAYEFTDINQSASMGLALKGDRWGRHDDTLGIAAVVNGLSSDAKQYFSAGGLGVLIGDGRLHYAPETIFEAYYAMKLHPQLTLSIDFQHITNPAYNRDRGPVSVYGARFHAEF